MDLEKKIKERKAHIGVIGLGYVGLPLVKTFLNAGFSVMGFDVDPRKVRLLNQGKSYIHHVTTKDLKPFIDENKFQATDEHSLLRQMNAIIICVPTPLDAHKNPDLSYVISTTQSITKNLQKGQLVVLESTTYPGTTEEKLLPLLAGKSRKVGQDFFLAYSPERENPGDRNFSTSNIPKVVGGVTAACKRLARILYEQIVIDVIPVSSTRVAEATKLLENIFRSINIALVNEMKIIFDRMDIDIWEVIKASSTKPFGFMPFFPGPGLGGHCIPVDPYYLTWKAREVDYATKFIELAGEINTYMPYYVVSRTVEALNKRGKSLKGSKILILGIAYKKDIDDQRESPALKIISLLQESGAKVFYNDPYVPRTSGYRDYPEMDMRSIPLTARNLKSFDAVLITTDHSKYDYKWIVQNAPLVVDTRNAVKVKRKNVVKA